MFTPSINKLIDIFSRFPTIGKRTATRFVFYVLKLPTAEVNEIIRAVVDLKKKVKTCGFCFNRFEDEQLLCPICRDKSRNQKIVCVVENETDLAAIEAIKKYQGLYFVLGGGVSRLREEDLKKLRLKELTERIKNSPAYGINGPAFEELILAFNPTSEGQSTILYLERELKPFLTKNKTKITKLGLGLPVGGEMEYADDETLAFAIESRR